MFTLLAIFYTLIASIIWKIEGITTSSTLNRIIGKNSTRNASSSTALTIVISIQIVTLLTLLTLIAYARCTITLLVFFFFNN